LICFNVFIAQARENCLKNPRLADICIGTSAAPTFLPAHTFKTKDGNGKTRTFDLIDGAMAANNPVRKYYYYSSIKISIS